MSELQGLEKQLQDAKELVARRDLALKVTSNPDFKKLILDEFVVQEMARLAGEAGDPRMDEKMQRDCAEMSKGGGHLKRWLSVIGMMGDKAETDIPQIEAMIIEVQNEEDND